MRTDGKSVSGEGKPSRNAFASADVSPPASNAVNVSAAHASTSWPAAFRSASIRAVRQSPQFPALVAVAFSPRPNHDTWSSGRNLSGMLCAVDIVRISCIRLLDEALGVCGDDQLSLCDRRPDGSRRAALLLRRGDRGQGIETRPSSPSCAGGLPSPGHHGSERVIAAGSAIFVSSAFIRTAPVQVGHPAAAAAARHAP